MKLNPHLHVILADGVCLPDPDGMPSFRALPRLKTDEVIAWAKASFARQSPSREVRNPSGVPQ
jgi:hypothetical protein